MPHTRITLASIRFLRIQFTPQRQLLPPIHRTYTISLPLSPPQPTIHNRMAIPIPIPIPCKCNTTLRHASSGTSSSIPHPSNICRLVSGFANSFSSLLRVLEKVEISAAKWHVKQCASRALELE